MVQAANSGPLITIQIGGPEYMRDTLNTIKDWGRRSNLDCAIFRGKSALSQMLELPIRASYSAIIKMIGCDSRSAYERGLQTNWLDLDKRWSITLHDKVLVRGRCNLDRLETTIDIALSEMEYNAAVELEETVKRYEQADRYGSLLEINCNRVEKFTSGEIWGRQRKGKGAGKGS